MVAQHLLNADIEPEVCERFIENDITGNILVKLKLEDLKELGIISFGVRIKVWGQIKSLAIAKVVEQSVGPLSQDDFEREMYQAPHHDSDSPQNHDSNDISNDIGDESKTLLRRNNAQRRSTQAVADTIMPGESISIVGIEQMIPKPHQCSKGENCSKWRRNRRIMDDFKKAYPFVDTDKSGAFIVTGHPESGKTEAALRPSGVPLRLMTEMIPSVVASSDVLGPGEVNTSFALEERTLCAIQTQDPQENVRQFLEFQHQQAERFGEVPPTPPFELVPSRNQQPHKGLRMLPKLSIPVQPRKTNPVTSNNVFRVQQQQRSNSRSRHIPPLTSKAYPLSSETASAAPTSVTSYTNTAIEESPSLTALVPHRFGTPFSDVDVPVTAFPDDPIARNVSQSVPPNMSYRTPHIIPFPRASARRPSFPLLPALDENKATAAHPVTPRKLRNIASVVGCRPLYCSSTSNTAVQATDTALSDTAAAGCPQPPPRTKYSWSAERVIFEKGIAPLSLITSTFSSSPSSSLVPATRALSTPPSMSDVSASKASSVKGTSGADTTYQGDVKKRTTRMLRHEWNDRYVTLEGTRMAVHKDKASMHHAALEVIDIDDYAISCSAMAASTSKLNAAFKAMNIRRGNADSAQESKDDVAAFAFQLIPQDMKNGLRCKKRDTANPTDNDGSLLSSSSSTKSVSSLSLSASAAPLHAGTVNATGKTHHFAVKSRDDRIEWMRKLMLAKAMRQKGEGFEVSVNGNMV
ncbi:hypothetical protein SEPCBS119000_001022 [Sporothrix epigloea]|uniref:Uncharacterized protein n=1 Tax=Sporothrix epigloea TaxID=1892477 RepID=A0ABP0DA52_9PEZI